MAEWKKYRNWICTLPCTVCHGGTFHEEVGQTLCDPCHVRSRGSTGGKVHFNNLIPMCRKHHQLQHSKGWVFLKKLCGLSQTKAKEVAVELTKRWVIDVEKSSMEEFGERNS